MAATRLLLADSLTGNGNLAAGYLALAHNDTGTNNVALGSRAGYHLTSGSDNVDIANPGVAGEAGTIRVGRPAKQTRTFLAGVWNTTIAGPTKAVVVDAAGRLGTAPAPAAPALRSQSKTLGRLRDKVHQQSVELRQQGAAIQRLRKQMQNGG